MSFKDDLIKLTKFELFNKFPDEPLDVLRHFFKFFAEQSDLLVEGLKFFSQFPAYISTQKFNSIKAFLFYFAYQTKKYSSVQVKELLKQELLNANITDPRVYAEFCMYCFYRGLYYIEKRDFFMATYYYCVAISMGLKGNSEDCKVLNNFSIQMIRSLCFLKSLTDFNIKSYLFREHRMYNEDELLLIKNEDINVFLGYIKNDKDDLTSFNNFIKDKKEMIKNYKLSGLKKEAEEALIFKIIKENLFLYKKIKIKKLSEKCKVNENDLMMVIRKKVMNGEINVKYDDITEVIEVFDVDPGLKERVQRTKELYKKIIDANKNLFITLRDKKMDEFDRKKYSKEEEEFMHKRHEHEIDYEDFVEMDIEDN